MKYGESAFDILYLLFAIGSGVFLLIRSKTKIGKVMGIAALVLGVGDSFHLVPRVLNYFADSDFTLALGVGKLVTSVTMTFFYCFLYWIWTLRFQNGNQTALMWQVNMLTLARVILCCFPQNGWFDNTNNLLWSILRNVPFLILGIVVCYLFFRERKTDRRLSPVWICILLSFAFYLPVAVGASYVSMLGMLMLPKTICYIVVIVSFLRFVNGENAESAR